MKLIIEEKDVGLEIDLNEVRAAIRPSHEGIFKLNNEIMGAFVNIGPHPKSGINSVQRGDPNLKSGVAAMVGKSPRKKPGRKPGRKTKVGTPPPVAKVATQITGESAL